ncbi:hypothetical protein HY448_01560 [Candidatus Pacearchaeota archaeon]|nr:hypothetical protein [Candidatus Pacearchaeota archaeon]
MAKLKSGKHTRREILETGFWAGVKAGFGGALGYVAGKGYESGRDIYGSLKKIGEGADKINPLNYLRRGEEQKTNVEETRRGFLDRFLGAVGRTFNEYSVQSSTALGASLGAYTGFFKRRDKIKTAQIRDEISEIKRIVKDLEERARENKKDALMIFMGIVGIFFSLTSISFSFTGYFVYGENENIFLWSGVIFIISLTLVIFKIYKIRKR